MREFVKKNIYNILIYGTVAFFTVLAFSLIFNVNVTTDEIFSLNMAKLGPKGIMDIIAADDHPPLYYFYGCLFELISPGNVHLQKFASILPYTATLIFIATVFRKRAGDLPTFLTLLFFCCVPCTMEYSVQIRMYTMAIFFVTICGTECYLALTENKVHNWILLCIGALASAYTVYFAFIAVCFEVGLLFIAVLVFRKTYPKRMLRFWISVAAMILLYLPWVPIFIIRINANGSDYFLPDMSPAVIWEFFTWTFDLETIPGFVYLFLVMLVLTGIAGLYLLIRKKVEGNDKALILFGFASMLIPTLVTLFGIVISTIISPIYTGRYVIIEMMQLAMFFGLVGGVAINKLLCDEVRAKIGRIVLIIATAFLLVSGAFQYYECFKQEYVGHLTDETLEFFREHVGPNDYILYNYEAMGFEYEYYFPPKDRVIYVRDFDFNCDYDNLWFLSNLYEWPITDADCYTYWISYEFMGTYGIEDNNFDVYRYYHNDFPKVEVNAQ